MGRKTDHKIKDFLARAKRKYKIEKAILFGSRARDDYLKDSDYDVILVSQDFKGIFFTKRTAMMYEFWKHYPLDIEVLCYTPEEFEKKRKQIGIIQQAVKEGVRLI